ncbi:hypothetical protein KCM76_07220 [Zooshikella marina]|uniref:DnaT DNA-binding domain-containing protein n=1 Tax=Zooshikella ganghwensis TaxID=202772 RepID=A0A4P9VSR1_9GAMM|nr:DnaT-like ssDNA-binding domain-containing protein [Zooshikella ganghwensis]MBU2705766.1 hypothetical protein [Zooshikella ganghwensis]RDH45040.1 hypothetical protein B9G39_17240 [Zooshikella ganghwensis]
MSNDRKRYNRLLNQGVPPWEIVTAETASDSPQHPVFGRGREADQQRSDNQEGTSGARVQPLPEDFEPDPRYVEWLAIHHGIPAEFIWKQLPDFKLYWLETGEARKAWQNRFKNHVIYQWKRQQSERRQNTYQSTAEELTDYSWANKFRFESGVERSD